MHRASLQQNDPTSAVSLPVPAPSAVSRPTFTYQISGLCVASEVELPSAFLVASPGELAQVRIGAARVPKRLPDAGFGGPDWQMSGRTFLLFVEGLGRFLISDGASIRYQVNREHDPGDLALCLLGTCLAILLQQRGHLVLHASAVSIGNSAVLFCGASGAGKSTMAAMLCQRGYPLLNDDTCNVTFDCTGEPMVSADGRMLKLWAGSLDAIDSRDSDRLAVRKGTDKFYIRPAFSDATPRRVAAVYMLEEGVETDPPSVTRLTNMEAITALRLNAYRPALVEAMDIEADYFRLSAALQRRTQVLQLRRPKCFPRTSELMDMLERHWRIPFRCNVTGEL